MKKFIVLVFISTSLLVKAQSPGGVATSLTSWHKADGNVPVVGTTLTAWNNQVVGGVNANAVRGIPTLMPAGLNFNPTVYLNNSSSLYANSQVLGSRFMSASNNSFFVVFTKELPIDVANNDVIAKWDQNSSTNRTTWEIEAPNGYLRFDFPKNNVAPSGRNIGTTIVNPLSFIGSANSNTLNDSLIVNGLFEYSKVFASPIALDPTKLGDFSIGADIAGLYTFQGHIAEIIYYNSHLSYTNRRKVESYLGLKYGITLGNTASPIDYLASDLSNIWNKSVVYQNHVAGIGRDDASALNQKQGTSQNIESKVTMALGAIATTNLLNGNTFAADKSFLTWGDDNKALSSAGVVDFAAPTISRIQRVWRSQEAGTVGTVKLRISLVGVTLATGCNSLNSYRLMVDGDGTFASGATLIAPSSFSVASQWVEFDVDFTAAKGYYFSLGRVADVLPTATLTGLNTICAGASTNLTATFTGTSPWSITYTDGTSPKTISGIATSPYVFNVTPASTSNYMLTAVSDLNCIGTFSSNALVTVNPYIAFNAGTYATVESSATNKPMLIVLGKIVNPTTVTIAITTTATIGTDYTFTPSTITIPAGTYDGTTITGIPLPFTVVDDLIAESTETLKFDILVATGDLSTSTTTCNLGIKSTTYTIIDDDCAKASLGIDKLYCEGVVINQTLSGPVGNDYYKWSKLENVADSSFSVNYTATTPGTYILKTGKFGNNLITNGDFSAGNTGFTTGYTYTTGIFPSGGGRYNLVSDNANNGWAYNAKDHTNGTGKYMFIDGNSVLGIKVWSQSITVVPNTDYVFSAWVHNLSPSGNNNPKLNFDISGTNIGGQYSVFSDVNGAVGRQWNQFYTTWNSGANTNITISIEDNVASATYNDFALDDIFFSNSGCSNSDTIVISRPLNPVVTVPANYTICHNATTTATSFTSVATGTVTYAWTNSNTSIGLAAAGTGNIPSFTAKNTTNLPIVATISVTPTANACAGNAKTFTITVNPSPTASLSGSSTNCAGLSKNLSIAFTGTSPWSVTYTDGTNPITISGITTNPYLLSVSPIVTTNYSLSAVSDAKCTGTMSGSATINVTPKPSATLSGSANICAGSSTNLSVSLTGTAPWNITYSDGSSPQTINGILTSPYNINVNPSSTKTYSLQNLNDVSCIGTTITGSAIVLVNPLPIVIANTTSTSICLGESVTLNGNGANTYTWNNGVVNAMAFNPSDTNSYIVKGTDANNCVAFDTITINVKPLPLAPVTTHVKICLNSTPAPDLSNNVTGYNLRWYMNALGGSSIALPVVNTAIVGSTDYYSTQTSGAGCEGPRAKLNVEVSDVPYAQFLSSNLNYCAGTGGVNLLVKDEGLNTVYEWFKDGVSQGTPGVNITFSGAVAGDWTVKVTNQLSGCTSNSTVATVIENPKPIAAISTSGTSLTYCANNATGIILSAAEAGANATYEWFKDNVSQSTASASNKNYSNAFAGSWTVKVVNALTNCPSMSSAVLVVEKAVPNATITNTASNADYCQGDLGITLQAQTVIGASYEWFKEGSSVGTSLSYTNALAGNWVLKVTLNGCTDTSVVFNITEKPLPLAIINTTTLSYCAGDAGLVLTASDAGIDATYEWFKDGNSQGAASKNIVFNNAQAGAWTLTTILNTCKASSSITNIKETSLPEAMITTSGEALKYCADVNGITLTAKDQGLGASYEWFNNNVLVATTSSNTLANALQGNWTMTVTQGCKASTLIATPVIEKPLPLASITSSLLHYCSGNPGITLTAMAVTGASYEWFKSGLSLGAPFFNNSYPNALGGDYFVKVSLNNCTSTAPLVTVVENTLPTASLSGNGSICNNTQTAPLSIALTGTAPWHIVYQKPDGATITATSIGVSPYLFNASINGSYQLLSVNDANCVGTVAGAATITYTDSPIINLLTSTRNCVPNSTNYIISFDILHGDINSYIVTGATGTLVGNTWTSDPISDAVTTAITVNDGNNCQPNTENFSKTCACPADGLLAGGGIICNDGISTSDLNITLQGTAPWDIEYTHDNGSPQTITGIVNSPYTFSVAANGVYALTKVHDANCLGSANGTATVTYYNFPTASISGNANICVGKDNAKLNINFTGTSPWDFTLVSPSGNKNFTGITSNPYVYVSNEVGNYTLSAVNDVNCLGRLADLSGSASIAAYVKPDTSQVKISCDNSNKYYISMTIVGGDVATYQVTGAQGTFSGNQWTSMMISSGTPTTLSITDGQTCFPISIPNLNKSCLCPATATISGDQTLCKDGTKGKVSIALQGTAPWIVNYKVDNGAAIAVSTTSTPLVIPSIDKTSSYSLVSVSDDKCIGTTIGTASVTVNTLPTVIVTGGGTACAGVAIPAINFTCTGALPYTLSYSDGTNTTTTNVANNKYQITSPSDGNYAAVALKDANGCNATSLLGEASVHILPLSAATISGANGICAGDQTPMSIKFTSSVNSPFKITYDGGAGYQIISGITSNPYSLNIHPSQTTHFKIIELLDKYNCSNKNIKDSAIVAVTKIPIFKINNDSPFICSGSNTSITFVSNVANTTYAWTATAPSNIQGVIAPSTGDSIHQFLSNTSNTTEKVIYTVTPTAFTSTQKACVGKAMPVTVYVRKPTVPELGLDRNDLCIGESVDIDAGNFPSGKSNGKSIGQYQWYVNDVLKNDTLNKQNFVLAEGSTKISVAYLNACGQVFMDSIRLTTKQHVNIYFDKGDTCLGFTTALSPLQLTENEMVNSWEWKMLSSGVTGKTTNLSPSYSYTFPATGKQQVQLSAYSDGCKIGDTIGIVAIKNCAIVAPNVFTPNGDGINDVWKIAGIEDFPNADIVVFNRWGMIVHHIPGTATVPWNGTNDSGQVLENGSYYYIITLNKVSGSDQLVKGYVTIIIE